MPVAPLMEPAPQVCAGRQVRSLISGHCAAEPIPGRVRGPCESGYSPPCSFHASHRLCGPRPWRRQTVPPRHIRTRWPGPGPSRDAPPNFAGSTSGARSKSALRRATRSCATWNRSSHRNTPTRKSRPRARCSRCWDCSLQTRATKRPFWRCSRIRLQDTTIPRPASSTWPRGCRSSFRNRPWPTRSATSYKTSTSTSAG